MKNLLFLLLFCMVGTVNATTYTWTGSSSINWNDASNWSPATVPGSADIASFTNTSTTYQPKLDTSRSIAGLTVSANISLDLNTYQLTVNGNTTLDRGTYSNGSLIVNGTTLSLGYMNAQGTVYYGPTLSCSLTVTAATLSIKFSTFNAAVVLTKTGSSTDQWQGGNTFNSTVSMTNSGSGLLNPGFRGVNTYNAAVSLYNQSSGSIGFSQTANIGSNVPYCYINADLYLSNTGSGEINLGRYAATYYSTAKTIRMAAGTRIRIAAPGFSSGTLHLENLRQEAADSLAFSLSGTALLRTTGCQIKGLTEISVPNLQTSMNSYDLALTFTISNGNNSNSWGGNQFSGPVTLNHSGASGFSWAIGGSDYFSSTLTLNLTGAGAFGIATGILTGTPTTFSDHVYVNNTGGGSGFIIGTYRTNPSNPQLAVFAADKRVIIGSGGFSSGILKMERTTFSGSSPWSLSLGGSGSTLYLGDNLITNQVFSGTAPNVIISGSTFNDSLKITKTGNSTNQGYGGTTYNGAVVFNINGTGHFAVGVYTKDLFNSDLAVNTTSSGGFYSGNMVASEILGSISFFRSGTGFLQLGSSFGGGILFTGSTDQSIYVSGSGAGEAQLYKATINKPSGKLKLYGDVNAYSAMTLTSGIIQNNGGMLHFRAGSSVSGASDASYIEGVAKKTGNTAFTFPLGAGGKYNPLAITAPSSASDAFTAEFISGSANASYSLSSKESSLDQMDEDGYWKLARSSGSSTPTVTLNWHSLKCGVTSPSTLSFAQWNAATSQWLNKGNAANTATSLTHTGTLAFSTTPIPLVLGNIHKMAANAGADTSFCAGASVGLSASGSYGTAPFTYSWSPTTGLSSSTVANPTASPASTTTYTVTVTDARGCSASDEVVVTVNELPVADAGEDTTIYAGDTVQIGGAGVSGNTYSWSPSIGLSSATIARPLASPSDSAMFVITVVNSTTGCIKQDTVRVNVLPQGATCGNAIVINAVDTVVNQSAGTKWYLLTLPKNNALTYVYDSLPNYTFKFYSACGSIENPGTLFIQDSLTSLLEYNEIVFYNVFLKVQIDHSAAIGIKQILTEPCEVSCNSLIINPCFEEGPIATYLNQLNSADNWFSGCNGINNPYVCNGDYCPSSGMGNTPDIMDMNSPAGANNQNNIYGTQLPFSEDRYACIGSTESFYGNLNEALKCGIKYKIRMQLSTHEGPSNSPYNNPTSNFVVTLKQELFQNSPSTINCLGYSRTIFSSGTITYPISNWQQQSNLFLLNEVEQNYSLKKIHFQSISGGTYIDNVELFPYQLNAGIDDTICEKQCDTIGPECFPYNSEEFIWTAIPFDSSLIGQEHLQNPIVCPDTTTLYILSLTADQGDCAILADTMIMLVIQKPDSIIWSADTMVCDTAYTYTLNLIPTNNIIESITWETPSIAAIVGGNGLNEINVEWSMVPDTILSIVAHIYFQGGCDTTDTLWVYPCCWDTTRIILPSGTNSSSLGTIVSGQNYIIYGLFNVDNDFTFDNCDVILAPNAIIGVYTGQDFTITNQSHLYACNRMWKTILLVAGSSITVNGSSIIEDAETAIWAYNGGTVVLDQAIFNKNYVGLKLENCGIETANVSRSYFACGSGFLYTAPSLLRPPRQNTESRAHIEILNTIKQTIGNTTNENWFKNATFGIYANNVGELNVLNNNFFDMNAGYNQSGTLGSGQLLYTGNGVCAVGQGASDEINVKDDNEFTNCDVGVKAQFYQRGNIIVNDNTFFDCKQAGVGFGMNSDKTYIEVNRNKLYANPNKSVFWGIYGWWNNSSKVRISQNELYFANNDTCDRQGIALRDVVSSANSHTSFLIDSNYIEGATRGIWVENMGGAMLNFQNLCGYSLSPNNTVNILSGASSDNTIYDNNIYMELVNGNNFRHSCDGIAIDNSSTVLTSCNYVGCIAEVNSNYATGYCYNWIPNGIRQDQGFANWIYNNETKDLGNGLLISDDVQPLNFLGWNKMEHLQRSGLLLNHGILGSQVWGSFARNQWVNWPTNGTPHSEVWGAGANGSLTTFYVPSTASAEYQPTNNTYSSPAFSAMNQPANTATLLSEAYTCANPELYNDIEEYCDNIGYLILPLIDDTTTLTSAFDSTARWENKYQIYKLLKSNTIKYYLSDTTLTAFVNLHDTTEIGLLHKSEIAVATMWNKKSSDLDDEIADLSSLSPSCVASQTMKTVLLTALTLHAEDRKPNNTETAELENLAAQCPYEYGSGVHSTRALLSRYDTTFVNRLNPCEIPVEPELRKSENEISSENTSATSIALFPNPTTGAMQLNIGEAMYGMLSVSDISGRIVYLQNKTWEVSNSINLSHLNNGVYLFDFKSQLITKKWKIVVSK